ncbi:MAG: carbohydrate kinase family protein [Suipraeoptans sp.]
MKYDVVTLGELLIDFTSNGVSENGNILFEANPGGAVSNVLAMLQKQGKKTAFLGKVGEDQFGKLLKDTLDKVGIDSQGLLLDKKYNTTLAFVHTFPDGDRDFSFYRKNGADLMIDKSEICYDIIKDSRAFHFGTLSMTSEPAYSATIESLDYAKSENKLITFDPNLREPLWDTLDNAKEKIKEGMQYCDVLKISDNEIQFVSGLEDYDDGIAFIREKYNIPLIFLTMGKDGSCAYYKDIKVSKQGYSVKTIETTGAGDTFTACAISGVLDYGIENLNEDNLNEILEFANAAAAIVTTRKGAIMSMPNVEEVRELITNGR